MLESMCDCPELQDNHVFIVGDYVYDNGMIDIFSWGTTKGGQASGYIWNECANELQRIPTRAELVEFTRKKLERQKKKGQRDTSNTEFVVDWREGGYFYVERVDQWIIFDRMGKWTRSTGDHRISIHKKRGAGWFKVDYPPIKYFYTWIPSQEQIQDTLRYKLECTHHDVRRAFYIWYGNPRQGDKKYRANVQCWTDRELWISFYMFQLHNKTWINNSWK